MKSISENYIVVQGWMISELNLSGNELLIYAIIHGFSQDGESKFTGSLAYLERWTNTSRPTVISALKKLCEKKVIIKHEKVINNVRFNEYQISLPVVKNLYRGSKESLHNKDNNNIVDNININYADKKSAKESSLKYDFKKLVEIWFEEYTKFKGTEPTFGAVEGKTLKAIANKIHTKDKDSINLPDNFRMILLMAQTDKWIADNFNLKIINSNFDKIYSNGTKHIDEERRRKEYWEEFAANHRPSY